MNATTRSNNLAQSTLLLALSSEAALFTTLVMSYLFLRTQASSAPFSRFGSADLLVASLNTLVLLASAVFAWGAARAILADNRRRLIVCLLAALALGALFVSGQVYEFTHSGLHIDSSVFGAAFFALISFHALHVLAGITILVINLARTWVGDFSARRHVGITVGTWFWYFVTAVWVVLYCVLYLV
jgi:cytochrome c oxidase subunit III